MDDNSNKSVGVKISCDADNSAVDCAICIKIEGATPARGVTIAALVEEAGKQFGSYAHYLGGERGEVDMSCDASVGGFYTGVEPMGLFWSMEPLPDQTPGLRLMKKNIQTPLRTKLSVYPGHVNPHTQSCTFEAVAETYVDRWYLTGNVDRIPVTNQDFVATLFVPHGAGPFPGVIDLFGTAGSLLEYRAALLASKGFVTLALAYYFPKEKKIYHDLSYFEKAADYLANHPKVSKGGVGALGVSKGADLALSMGAFLPQVKAIVSINGYPVNTFLDLTYNGELLLTMSEFQDDNVSHYENGDVLLNSKGLKTMEESSIVPVERSRDTHYLVINCEEDATTSDLAIETVSDRLAQHGLSSNFESVLYPGAGHLLEPPHSPLCYRSFHSMYGLVLVWGGEKRLHARAQEDSWRRIQRFFKKHLLDVPTGNVLKIKSSL